MFTTPMSVIGESYQNQQAACALQKLGEGAGAWVQKEKLSKPVVRRDLVAGAAHINCQARAEFEHSAL